MTIQPKYQKNRDGFDTALYYPTKKYIAAVAFDGDGNCLAVSKPRALFDGSIKNFETSCSDVSTQSRPSIRFNGDQLVASWPSEISEVASWGLLASNSYKTMSIQRRYQTDKTGDETILQYPNRKYLAGVAFDSDGNCLATTAPRRLSDGSQVDFTTSCRGESICIK